MNIIVSKFGESLISRPAGKEAYLVLQPDLGALPADEGIVLDFSGVSVFTPSWADEFITPLMQRFGGRVSLKNTGNPSVRATLATLQKSRRK
jgi:hypothetical protein